MQKNKSNTTFRLREKNTKLNKKCTYHLHNSLHQSPPQTYIFPTFRIASFLHFPSESLNSPYPTGSTMQSPPYIHPHIMLTLFAHRLSIRFRNIQSNLKNNISINTKYQKTNIFHIKRNYTRIDSPRFYDL